MATPRGLIVIESPSSADLRTDADVAAIARPRRGARHPLPWWSNTWGRGPHLQAAGPRADLQRPGGPDQICRRATPDVVHAGIGGGRLEPARVVLGPRSCGLGLRLRSVLARRRAYQMLRGLRTLPTRMGRCAAVVPDRGGVAARSAGGGWCCTPGPARLRQQITTCGGATTARPPTGLFGVVLKLPVRTAAVPRLPRCAQACSASASPGSGFESLAIDADAQQKVRQSQPAFDGRCCACINIGPGRPGRSHRRPRRRLRRIAERRPQRLSLRQRNSGKNIYGVKDRGLRPWPRPAGPEVDANLGLNTLGFGPCRHMVEVFADPESTASSGQVDARRGPARLGRHLRRLPLHGRLSRRRPLEGPGRLLSGRQGAAHPARPRTSEFESYPGHDLRRPRSRSSSRLCSRVQFFASFLGHFGDRMHDRAFMTDYFRRHGPRR